MSKVNKVITRKFIDCYKTSFDIYGFLNAIILEYWNDVNTKILRLYSNDYKQYMYYDKIFQKYLPMYRLFNIAFKKEMHDLSFSKTKDILSRIKTDNTPNIIFCEKRQGEAPNKFTLEYFYNKEISLLLEASDAERFRFLNLNEKDVSYHFYESIIEMIPYIYKRLAHKMLSILDLNSEEYSVTFYKMYDDNKSLNSKTGHNDNYHYGDYLYKYTPFITFSNKLIFNYITNDFKPIQHKDIVPIIIFPTSEKIITGNFETRYIGCTHPYSQYRLPTIAINDTTFEKVIPNGYLPIRITIGNIVNNLQVNIIHKATQDTTIFAYNDFGTNPKIIHNINSIVAISRHNKTHIEDIVDGLTMQEYNNNETKINELLVDAIKEYVLSLKKFNIDMFNYINEKLAHEIDTNEMYNNGITSDKLVDPNGNIPIIYTYFHKGSLENISTRPFIDPSIYYNFKHNRYEYSLRKPNLTAYIKKTDHNVSKSTTNEYFRNIKFESDYANYLYPLCYVSQDHLIEQLSEPSIVMKMIDHQPGIIYSPFDIALQLKRPIRTRADINCISHTKYPDKLRLENTINSFIVFHQYIIPNIITFIRNNGYKLMDAMYFDKVRTATEIKRKNIELRATSFKQAKLEYYNHLKTNGNVNTEDLSIETSYYNMNLKLHSKYIISI